MTAESLTPTWLYRKEGCACSIKTIGRSAGQLWTTSRHRATDRPDCCRSRRRGGLPPRLRTCRRADPRPCRRRRTASAGLSRLDHSPDGCSPGRSRTGHRFPQPGGKRAPTPGPGAQVDRLGGHCIDELLDLWEQMIEPVTATLALGHQGSACQLVFDALTHEHDIRGALIEISSCTGDAPRRRRPGSSFPPGPADRTAAPGPPCPSDARARRGAERALFYHGSPFPTEDDDITPEASKPNLIRLAAALGELNARIRTQVGPEGLSFRNIGISRDLESDNRRRRPRP